MRACRPIILHGVGETHMTVIIFIKAFLVGIAVAAPLGPVGVLCIDRSLRRGMRAGVMAGLGAAFADAFYAALAAFGLSALSDFINDYKVTVYLTGGILLVVIGLRNLLKRTPVERKPASLNDMVGSISTAFVVTITNPGTLLGMMGLLALAGLSETANRGFEPSMLVAGVFAGSMTWWILLSLGTILFRRRITETGLKWTDRVVGIILVGAGVAICIFQFLRNGS